VKDKIRQQPQVLRDAGLLLQVERGVEGNHFTKTRTFSNSNTGLFLDRRQGGF
jgi:hypothetical protein